MGKSRKAVPAVARLEGATASGKTESGKCKGPSMSISLIVLAAGRGTRMKSDRPKVLHELAGIPLFHHALASGAALEPVRTVLVAGR